MRNPIGYTVNGKFHETVIPAIAALLEKRGYFGDIDLHEMVTEFVTGEVQEIHLSGLVIKAEFEEE